MPSQVSVDSMLELELDLSGPGIYFSNFGNFSKKSSGIKWKQCTYEVLEEAAPGRVRIRGC